MLDHLTRGRAGWNIVTSYLNSGARNQGLKQQLNHQQRYALAAEYLEVCYKLWEASWDDDAVVADRKSGVYADPRKVHRMALEIEANLPGIYRFWLPRRKGAVETVKREEPKVGRNDDCPCGSGKKYKKCCGADASE